MSKKQKMSSEQAELIARQKSFQERIPIARITKGLVLSKKKEYFPVFALGQRTVELMSEDEIYSFARQLETTFATLGLSSVHFLLLPVPFDLAPYKNNQQNRIDQLREEEIVLKNRIETSNDLEEVQKLEKALDQNEICQKYINDQLAFTAKCLQTGRIANKHSYVICKTKDCWNETAVLEASNQIEQALRSVADDSHRCSNEEIEKILIELYNPLRPEIYINA